MRDLGHQLKKQAIQHYATKGCGFLHLFHTDVNLKFWQEWFTKRLGKSEGENIVMGLIPGFIYDGIKWTAGVTEKKGVQGVQVEFLMSDHVSNGKKLKEILASQEFKDIYGAPVWLVPPYDRFQTVHYNEKIKKLIPQHGQMMQSVEQVTLSGVSTVDDEKKIKGENWSLRQLIMSCKEENNDQIFLSVDEGYFKNNGMVIRYKCHYEKQAKLFAHNVGAYLKKEYGTTILEWFDADEQMKINDTQWIDDVPHSKTERELGDICDEIEGMELIKTKSKEESEMIRPTIVSLDEGSGKCDIVIDTGSVSTFGMMQRGREKDIFGSPDVSSVSGMTLDSRVSGLENSLVSLEEVMKQELGGFRTTMTQLLQEHFPASNPTKVSGSESSAGDLASSAQMV